MIFAKSVPVDYGACVRQLHLESVGPLYSAYGGGLSTFNPFTRRIGDCHYRGVNLSKDQNHKMIQISYYGSKFMKGYAVLYKESSSRQKCIF
jgi:hypothetical protein